MDKGKNKELLVELLTGTEDLYGVFQLKKDTPPGQDHLEGVDSLKRMGITAYNYANVIPDNYNLLFVDSLSNLKRPTIGETLEAISEEFKDTRLSLTRSDIVVLHQNGKNSAHFVDSFGFTGIPDFTKALEEAVLSKDNIGIDILTLQERYTEAMRLAGYCLADEPPTGAPDVLVFIDMETGLFVGFDDWTKVGMKLERLHPVNEGNRERFESLIHPQEREQTEQRLKKEDTDKVVKRRGR